MNIQHCISTLTSLAGLIHDIGKATDTFQAKLLDDAAIGLDVMRHERLSCAILSSLYEVMIDGEVISDGDDRDFFHTLSRLTLGEIKALFAAATQSKKLEQCYANNKNSSIKDLERDLWHNEGLDNVCLFNALYFLVLTHHKLPQHNGTEISEHGYINENQKGKPVTCVANAPFECDEWLLEFQRQCNALCQYDFEPIYNNIEAFTSAVLYIARPALVITDQHISQTATVKARTDGHKGKAGTVYANSYSNEQGQRHMAQPLNQHLTQVSQESGRLTDFIMQDMPDTCLPALNHSPPNLTTETSLPSFVWQNEALAIAESLPPAGNLILISSETGAGKTRANAKVASGLRNHRQLRLTTLLGMNTLTKQTATEYINDVGLGGSACAITGHAVTRYEIDQALELANGCENLNVDELSVDGLNADGQAFSSSSFTVPDNLSCHFKPKYDQILATPIVVATIDHLIEGIQSGKSTATRLLQRLQTSDIVIDEIDSYNAKSLIPIYKLVYSAGLFHRNLIVSSATLRPSVAHTLIQLFQSGLDHHNSLFNTQHTLSGAVINSLEGATFAAHNAEQFNDIIERQRKAVLKDLLTRTSKRRLDFIDASNAADVFYHAKKLHHAHCVQVHGLNFSAGVIRLNNVKYVQAFARALGKFTDSDTEIAVINYHSRIASPVRYRVETCLDQILKRKNPESFARALLAEVEFERTLANARARNVQNIMLILVCSPIEETGRDHDFDYGITEPCSHHSLIQLAGRIRRHRDAAENTVENMLMLNRSLKEQYEPLRKPYLSMPGAETQALTLSNGITAMEAFACDGVDYTQRIDARACLIDYNLSKTEKAQYSTLNEIEVQQVYNAHFDIFEFIDNAHIRLSESHALTFPLRDSNDDIPVWYDGQIWLMPASSNRNDKSGRTEQCNWNHVQEDLPNLWFNQDIDTILLSLNPNPKLKQLLCSQHSHFKIRKKDSEKLQQCYFSCALGLFNPKDNGTAMNRPYPQGDLR